MKKTILGFSIMILIVLNINLVLSENYWVDDPSNCPQTNEDVFSGQSCSPENICGDDSGTAQCYETSLLTPPSTTTNAQINVNTYSGGYLINCFADGDDEEPKCDNNGDFWCNSDDECSDVNRITLCNESTWASDTNSYTCGSCTSEFTYCDGSYTDDNGCEIEIETTSYPNETNAVYNESCGATCESGFLDCDGDLGEEGTGCEIEEGTACTTDEDVSGKWVGCDCVPDESFFQTGTKSTYASNNPLIWGEEKGTGKLLQLINATGHNITIDENACITYPDGTVQCTATTGSSSESAGWTNTSTETTTDLNVGIGTDNPTSNLHVIGNANITGTIHANTIEGEANLNTNSSDYWDGLDTPQDINTSDLTNDGTYLLKTGDTATGNYTFNTNTMHIDSTNNRIGIGTTTPTTKLEINGTAGYSSTTDMGTDDTAFASKNYVDTQSGSGFEGNGNTNQITKWTDTNSLGDSIIYDNGSRIGIGTNNPTQLFHVIGQSEFTGDVTLNNTVPKLRLIDSDSTTKDTLRFEVYERELRFVPVENGGSLWNSRMQYNFANDAWELFDGDITLKQNGAGTFHIDDSGNIGIGDATPDAKLDVEGNAYITSGIYTDKLTPYSGDTLTLLNGAGNKLHVDGALGIGTTSPSEKFEVSDGSKSLTVNPDSTEPTINTTDSSDVKITSSGGSVIIQLG